MKNKRKSHTCTTETREILDPVSDGGVGGVDNLDPGLAEYAESEADRTFNIYMEAIR